MGMSGKKTKLCADCGCWHKIADNLGGIAGVEGGDDGRGLGGLRTNTRDGGWADEWPQGLGRGAWGAKHVLFGQIPNVGCWAGLRTRGCAGRG